MKNTKLFVERLKDFMSEHELNTNRLAKIMDCDFQTVSFWLEGRYYPRHNMLIALANHFNCSIDFLLGISDCEELKLGASPSNFHERLNSYLQRNKMSRYRLSKLSKIGDGVISKWINGGRVPETENLITLAEIFSCSVDCLLGRSDEKYF